MAYACSSLHRKGTSLPLQNIHLLLQAWGRQVGCCCLTCTALSPKKVSDWGLGRWSLWPVLKSLLQKRPGECTSGMCSLCRRKEFRYWSTKTMVNQKWLPVVHPSWIFFITTKEHQNNVILHFLCFIPHCFRQLKLIGSTPLTYPTPKVHNCHPSRSDTAFQTHGNYTGGLAKQSSDQNKSL